MDCQICVIATFILSQYLTRPLAKLLEATRAMANWSYEGHRSDFGSDEMRGQPTAAIAVTTVIETGQETTQPRTTELSSPDAIPPTSPILTELRETFRELTELMAQLMGCQICVIATYDDHTGIIQAQPPGHGVPDELVCSFRYRADLPAARDAWNFRLQGPLLVNDIEQVPDFFSQWVERFALSNILVVPMTIEGSITGLVYVANKAGGFTQDDSTLLTIFAGQVGVIIDNARLFEETKRLAATDPLTGLWNRRHLEERHTAEAARAHRSGQPLSVLVMDMDDLKLLNDTFGHPAADEAILMVAEVLMTVCREIDIVGRYGGDEFAIILPETDAQGATVLAERILAALEKQPFRAPDGTEVPLSVSIGAASYPSQSDDADQLFSLADAAMYAAKVAGGGQFASAAGGDEETLEEVNSHVDVLNALLVTIDSKDHHTIKHSREVTERALALARAVGLSRGQLRALKVAATLHDVGKIGIPTDVLTTQKPLTQEEQKMLQDHPRAGYILLQQIPHMESVSQAVLYHHERYDGTGYPVGLGGDEIPLLARILGIADAFSNMIAERPDQKSMSLEAAVEEIGAKAGTHFDPELAQEFTDLVEKGEMR